MKFTNRPDSIIANGRRLHGVAALALGLCLSLAVMLSGCASIGPKTVPVDRFDYSTAIADSWKQQTLLNIVKLRYMDLPVFLDVSSIVAGYSLQTGVSVSGVASSDRAVQGNYASVGGQAIYTDRPTITYAPMTGEKFLRGLITPIDPKNIFFMLQAGYAADFILGLTVESINGVRNRSTAGGMVREADPEFARALVLLREVQTAGGFGMRVEEDKVKGSTAVLIFRREDLPPDIAEKATEVRRLLKLPPDQQRAVLTYSPMRGAEGELAINSRSLLQIMQAFASYMDAPEEHLKNHSVLPAFEGTASDADPPKVRIHSGKEKPAGAFASVHYHDYWYWVDDGDWRTKRALTAVMFFFTLTETGEKENLPLITIPAQRQAKWLHFGAFMAFTHNDGPGITANQALRRLVDGNRRFLRGEARFPTVQKEILAELAKEQRPYATILGCSDSRVPPELLFDASFGELFVIRVAGNVLSDEIVGSLQYAGVHLKTPLFVVLGHEGCGAVSAAVETHFHGVRHRSRIAKLLRNIIPAVKNLNPKLPPDRLLAQAVEANVRWTMKQLFRSPEGKARVKENRLKLIGAIYQIKTGRVRFLP